MKNITNKYSNTLNAALLLLRAGAGIMMLPHGYDKLMHYSEMKGHFMSWMGLSPAISLGLDIFAEFGCSILIILGLLTRLATIPLMIAMTTALVMVHAGDIFGKGQAAMLFLIYYIVILFSGPGRYSIDAAIGK